VTVSILGLTSCGDTKKKKEEVIEAVEEAETPQDVNPKIDTVTAN
jgi:hypothetical protein